MRLVENTEARVHTFGDPNGDGFELLPGVNEVAAEKIDSIERQKNACWLWYVGKRLIRVKEMPLQREGGEEGDVVVTNDVKLADLHKVRPVESAVDLVKNTFDKAVLLGWQTGKETRKTVLTAIGEQLQSLEEGDRPPGDDE